LEDIIVDDEFGVGAGWKPSLIVWGHLTVATRCPAPTAVCLDEVRPTRCQGGL